MWSRLLLSHSLLRNGARSWIIDVAERRNRRLRLSGDGLWLMLIRFPTGDVAAGVFYQKLFGGFIFFFSLLSH